MMPTARACIEGLRVRALDAVRPLLRGAPRVALFDFPNYSNVGDTAIYLGQLALLHDLGVTRPAFVCDFLSYDASALRRAVGDGVIVLTGGGSFGDLWPEGQAYREQIVRDFPGNAIVQLAQTVRFGSAQAVTRAGRVFGTHQRFTLLVRDRRSLEIARDELCLASSLCPDLAFCLGPLERPSAAWRPIVWLSRGDREAAAGHRAGADVTVLDWLEEGSMPLRELSYWLIGATRRTGIGRMARRLLMRTYTPLARQRLHRGITLLSSAEVVITDRLHGHILSLLLGIPHVLLDNSNGKISGFHAAWTAGVDGVHWASSADEALELARALTRTGHSLAGAPLVSDD